MEAEAMKDLNTVPVDSGTQVQIETSDIPAYVAVNLAQAAFRAIHRAWEDPATQEDYRRWKAARNSGMEGYANDQ